MLFYVVNGAHSVTCFKGGYIYFETSHQPIPTISSAQLNEPISGSNASTSLSTRLSSGNALLRPLLTKFPIFSPSSVEISNELPIPTSSFFQGPNISDTGPNGLCLSFFYSIDGLSADNLQIMLRDVETSSDRQIWQSSEGMEGAWVRGEVAYTYGSVHKVSQLLIFAIVIMSSMIIKSFDIQLLDRSERNCQKVGRL